MPNKIKRSGDGLALQVTKPARTAGLVEETDDKTTSLANIRVFAFDKLLLVIDIDRTTDEHVVELAITAARDIVSIYRVADASLQTAGNGYQVQLPGAADTGFHVGDQAPCTDGTNTLTVESYANPGGARGRLRATAESIGLDSAQQGYGLIDVEAAVSIGETGTVTSNQPTPGTWQTVSLEGAYDDPVVLMQPISNDGSHPCHVRLRNVRSRSFEFRLEEWAYLDGTHIAETVSYLVLEAGGYTSDTGTQIEAGTTSTDHTFSRTTFSRNFTTAPVVLTQAQTFNGFDPIVTRQRNRSTNGTEIRLQEEEEARDGFHRSETVGYIAVERGVSELNTVRFEAGLTPNAVTHNWYSTAFERTYENPVFIADLQTYGGDNPAALRYHNLGDSTVDVRVEEERSQDPETNHTSETVGYLTIDGPQLI